MTTSTAVPVATGFMARTGRMASSVASANLNTLQGGAVTGS